jgi:hypothetical protein
MAELSTIIPVPLNGNREVNKVRLECVHVETPKNTVYLKVMQQGRKLSIFTAGVTHSKPGSCPRNVYDVITSLISSRFTSCTKGSGAHDGYE